MSSRSGAVALLVALAAGAGCGSATPAADAAAVDTGLEFIPCTNDLRVDHYMPGMEKPGASGHFKVKLLASDPAPPAQPLNTWTVEVTDGAGAPASGVTMVVSPYMPDHKHAPPITPTVSALGEPGRYS